MMKPITNIKVDLMDVEQRKMGEVTIERKEDNVILGIFVPCLDFSAVEQLFQDFEQAVEVQALSVVDELDAKIADLGLYLLLPNGKGVGIHDVQIYSDGSMSCRLYDEVLTVADDTLGSIETIQPMQANI